MLDAGYWILDLKECTGGEIQRSIQDHAIFPITFIRNFNCKITYYTTQGTTD